MSSRSRVPFPPRSSFRVWASPLAQCSGHFWEREYFDTLIRDEEHLKRAIRYTEANPVKAGLVAEWKSWPWGSARLRDEYECLPWQRAGAAA